MVSKFSHLSLIVMKMPLSMDSRCCLRMYCSSVVFSFSARRICSLKQSSMHGGPQKMWQFTVEDNLWGSRNTFLDGENLESKTRVVQDNLLCPGKVIFLLQGSPKFLNKICRVWGHCNWFGKLCHTMVCGFLDASEMKFSYCILLLLLFI